MNEKEKLLDYSPKPEESKAVDSTALTPAEIKKIMEADKRQKKINLGTYFVIVLALISIIFFSLYLLSTNDSLKSSVPTPTPPKTLIVEDIKRNATSISYDELMRNTENHTGEVIWIRGKVLQVIEDRYSDSIYALRIGTKTWWRTQYDRYARDTYYTIDYYPEDVIYVEYKGKRVLENDIVDVWGKVKGRIRYEALLGNVVTIPAIEALHLELVQKAGD